MQYIHYFQYEEMKADIRTVISKLCKFLGKSLDSSLVDAIIEHTRFKNMKDNPQVNYTQFEGVLDITKSPFMRKGQVGDWKNHFTDEQVKYYDAMVASRLKDTGLEKYFNLQNSLKCGQN